MPPHYSPLYRKLYSWYGAYGRTSLPWRQTSNPYHIYVSEIMLQQTQVKTVLERFYYPFLAKFPTLTILADAHIQDVLKAWEGLGYYIRARNLHCAAQIATPRLPDTVEALQQLPGIGKNTAAAIAAFAYKQAVPVMEANLKRVLSRFFALTQPSDKELWENAYRLLDTNNPFDYNQAMMDIGALLCTVKQPRCDACPLSASCKGKHSPELYFSKKSSKIKVIRQHNIMIWHNPYGALYLAPRQTRLLSGMYGFMQYERKNHPIDKNAVWLGSVIHHYSHFTLDADVYYMTTDNAALLTEGMWYHMDEIGTLPLSGADKKVLSLLQKHPLFSAGIKN